MVPTSAATLFQAVPYEFCNLDASSASLFSIFGENYERLIVCFRPSAWNPSIFLDPQARPHVAASELPAGANRNHEHRSQQIERKDQECLPYLVGSIQGPEPQFVTCLLESLRAYDSLKCQIESKVLR